MSKFLPKNDEQVLTEERVKTQKPSMYKVLLHNDDYTTMEFVISVLMKHFGKSESEATQIMLHVHNAGVGIAGVFTYEVAETKVLLVTEDARRQDYPLRVTMERSD